jgi:hypothetical protein
MMLTALTTLNLSTSHVTTPPSLDKLTALTTLNLQGRSELLAASHYGN